MGLVTAASIIAFITTEMDDFIVLFVLFSKVYSLEKKIAVIIGKYVGLTFVVVACKYFSDILCVIPRGMLGLLGLIPIFIGIWYGIQGYKKKNTDSKKQSISFKSLFFVFLVAETFVITLADSGDNIAVYISFFTSLSQSEFITACIVFAVMEIIWCLTAIAVMNAKSIKDYILESHQVIIPLLFVVLGVYILLNDGTILWALGK